jgi:hypothetical protein
LALDVVDNKLAYSEAYTKMAWASCMVSSCIRHRIHCIELLQSRQICRHLEQLKLLQLRAIPKKCLQRQFNCFTLYRFIFYLHFIILKVVGVVKNGTKLIAKTITRFYTENKTINAMAFNHTRQVSRKSW